VGPVREAERAAAEWPRLQVEEDDLAPRITEREHRLDTARADLRRTELLLDLHERWSSRRTAQEQLAAAPEGEPIPAETVQRLATLRPEVDVLRTRETDLAKQVGDLEPIASAAVPHEDLRRVLEGAVHAVPGAAVLGGQLPRHSGMGGLDTGALHTPACRCASR